MWQAQHAGLLYAERHLSAPARVNANSGPDQRIRPENGLCEARRTVWVPDTVRDLQVAI